MDIDRALADISDIRSQLATVTHFRGYGPQRLVIVAALSAVITCVQWAQPDRLAGNASTNVAIWGSFLLMCICVAGVDAASRSRQYHGISAGPLLYAAVRTVAAFTSAAAIISFAIAIYAPDAVWMLPGIWFLLIALIGTASYSSMPPAILLASAWFFLCGTTFLCLGRQEVHLMSWMIGIPLIVGNLITALILHQEDNL